MIIFFNIIFIVVGFPLTKTDQPKKYSSKLIANIITKYEKISVLYNHKKPARIYEKNPIQPCVCVCVLCWYREIGSNAHVRAVFELNALIHLRCIDGRGTLHRLPVQ